MRFTVQARSESHHRVQSFLVGWSKPWRSICQACHAERDNSPTPKGNFEILHFQRRMFRSIQEQVAFCAFDRVGEEQSRHDDNATVLWLSSWKILVRLMRRCCQKSGNKCCQSWSSVHPKCDSNAPVLPNHHNHRKFPRICHEEYLEIIWIGWKSGSWQRNLIRYLWHHARNPEDSCYDTKRYCPQAIDDQVSVLFLCQLSKRRRWWMWKCYIYWPMDSLFCADEGCNKETNPKQIKQNLQPSSFRRTTT